VLAENLNEVFLLSRFPIQTLPAPQDFLFQDIVLTSDNNYAFVTDLKGRVVSITIEDKSHPKILFTLNVTNSVTKLRVTKNNKLIVVAGREDGLFILNAENP
jgi:hypothetical protein